MKIAILGAAGRMGQNLLRCASKLNGCDIVAAVERSDHPAIGARVKEVTGIRSEALPETLCFTDEWPEEAETVIDFTFHTTVVANVKHAVANGQAYVLGTTGLSEGERQAVYAAAAQIPVVWAPNMSLGVNLLLELVRRSAAILGPDYDAEIVEMHHRLKKDAPSGTALGLAEALAEGRGVNLKEVACYGREGITGERPRGEIGIHALRGGSVIGDHTVMFVADEERIEITHKANSREAFATGALRAALWLKDRKPGVYTMRHVLGFEDA
jgi:4-hydroxy-tetrahydrodipicolinate reductase